MNEDQFRPAVASTNGALETLASDLSKRGATKGLGHAVSSILALVGRPEWAVASKVVEVFTGAALTTLATTTGSGVARLETVADWTIHDVAKGLAAGKTLRLDWFQEDQSGGRPPAAELAEGVLILARDEHQHRKLRRVAALLASLLQTPGISRDRAIRLITIAKRLTFRQMCLLRVLDGSASGTLSPSRIESPSLETSSLLDEAFELVSIGLLCEPMPDGTYHAILGPGSIQPSSIRLTPGGTVLHRLFLLDDQGIDEADKLPLGPLISALS